MISTNIELAVYYLNQNGVIGFPTETVYGLAGNAFSEQAIKRIYAVKQRPSFNPLIVHIKSRDVLETVATDIPEKAQRLANAFWPGPLTLILKKQSHIPDLVTANQETVAVRVPNHPMALTLLRQLNYPLVAPSANPFTRISPTKATHVAHYFKNKIDMVLDGGNCSAGIESTIIGFDEEAVLVYRLGALSLEAIEKVVGTVTLLNKSKKKPIAPGMLGKHYAPKTEFIVTNSLKNTVEYHSSKKIGLLLFQELLPDFEENHQIVLSSNGDLKEAAANLYSALHQMDQQQFDVIIAERFPEFGLGITINDRLERAAKN